MFSTTEVIVDLIKGTPYLEEALAEDLINYSSLARKIRPQVEKKLMKDIKEGAIIMALKRASSKLRKTLPKSGDMLNCFGDIIIRSNLVDYTFESSHTLGVAQTKLLKEIEDRKDVFITISHGVSQVTIIASKNIEDLINRFFKGETAICAFGDLSSLTIRITKEATEIPGVLYYVLKILAWNGINIIECVSNFTELTIILHSKDIDRAFTLIKNQTENHKL